MDLKDFDRHLQTLQPNDWNRLFALLPEIEKTHNFGALVGGEPLPNGSITGIHWAEEKIIHETVNICNDLQLVVVFDWTAWEEGKRMLQDPHTNFAELDTITLCKLITIIIRSDRFNEGTTILFFENGVFGKIISAIKGNATRK